MVQSPASIKLDAQMATRRDPMTRIEDLTENQTKLLLKILLASDRVFADTMNSAIDYIEAMR